MGGPKVRNGDMGLLLQQKGRTEGGTYLQFKRPEQSLGQCQAWRP